MPEMDGVSLALKVSKDYPSTKIMMMSGYAHQRQRVHNLDCLAHDVLTKPFSLEEIIEKVNAVLVKKTA